MRKLSELASTIRSKNAGVNQITSDIIFPDRHSYRRAVESGAITKESVAKFFGIPLARISHIKQTSRHSRQCDKVPSGKNALSRRARVEVGEISKGLSWDCSQVYGLLRTLLTLRGATIHKAPALAALATAATPKAMV